MIPFRGAVAAAMVTLLALSIGCAPRPRFREGVSGAGYSSGESYGRFRTGQCWTGMASYYGPKFHGRRTANGELFDMNGLTAAHRELPFGTVLKVTNLSNGRSCTVRVNDRGPFVSGRMLDLSLGAARKLDMVDDGVVEVRVEVVSLGEP